MAASETVSPTLTSVILTSQTYRDRYRPTQLDMIDDTYGGTGLQVSNSGGTQVSIANGGAVVQACRYDLTGGPLLLNVPANIGAANRFDIVCLTYDSTHVPVVYLRLITGTAGAGIPAISSSLTGVWDFPIAHYEKQPGGSIVNVRDRRKFGDGNGGVIGADDTSGTSGIGWFPPAPRAGATIRFMPSGNAYTWYGLSWGTGTSGGTTTPFQFWDGTNLSTTSTTYQVGSALCSGTFTAPASGKVMVTVLGRGGSSTDNLSWALGWQLRLTNSSGTIFQDFNDDKAAQSADIQNVTSVNRSYVSGLTPGVTYYIQTGHRSSSSGASVTLIDRTILVEPLR